VRLGEPFVREKKESVIHKTTYRRIGENCSLGAKERRCKKHINGVTFGRRGVLTLNRDGGELNEVVIEWKTKTTETELQERY